MSITCPVCAFRTWCFADQVMHLSFTSIYSSLCHVICSALCIVCIILVIHHYSFFSWSRRRWPAPCAPSAPGVLRFDFRDHSLLFMFGVLKPCTTTHVSRFEIIHHYLFIVMYCSLLNADGQVMFLVGFIVYCFIVYCFIIEGFEVKRGRRASGLCVLCVPD